MNNYQAVANRYIDSWNQRDAGARKAALDALWADDGRYADPLVEADGPDAIGDAIAHAQTQFPGFVFRLTGTIDGHHDFCRFSWEFGPEGGAAPIAGSDVALVGPDGTLRRVVGFIDKMPAA